MGSKHLYEHLRANSLYKQQAQQLKGERSTREQNLEQGGDHCLFQRVCHLRAGHTSTCNYFKGTLEILLCMGCQGEWQAPHSPELAISKLQL